jgi:[acyl-carrier-protein] S-malonyltransferase
MDAVTKIITEASKIGICEIANDNAPGQIVISGEAKAVNEAIKISSDFGVRKAMSLPVSAPFHCSMMKPAAEVMAAALEKTDINSPDVPLVANVSALVGNGDPSEIRNSLVEQVTSLVRWRETVLWLSKQNISSVIEIGAGKILSGLNKRIDKQLISVSIAELEEIDNFLIKVGSGE